MQTNRKPIMTNSLNICTSIACASIVMTGCTKSKIAAPRTAEPQQVTLEDFIDDSPEQNDIQHAVTETQSQQDADSALPRIITQDQPATPADTDGITLSSSQLKNDATIADSSSPPGNTYQPTQSPTELLDAKVGDVNGKPIFTSSFFAPIEDRLIAEAARQSPNNWRQSTGQIIANRLDGIIADELLRAEALAALSPTQRVGLQAFLGNFRNELLSKNLGSSQLARQRIQREQGQTLDQALQQKEIDTLVQLTLIREVNRRVNVSWRDIKQRYERDIKEFSPPPTAMFRVIRAFASETETVNEIQSQLDAGTDFLKIAAGPLNNYNTDTDGFHTTVIEDTYETTAFFGPDVLNEPAQKLAIGESVGPIELGSSIYWIKLMDIQQESISLYDAQLQIQRELTFERRAEAQKEYLGRLMERARVSSRDEVLMRLLQIAEERYGPKG